MKPSAWKTASRRQTTALIKTALKTSAPPISARQRRARRRNFSTQPETADESDDTEQTAPTRDQDADEAIGMEDSEPETDDSTDKDSTEDVNAADISSDNEEPDDETSALNLTTAGV